MRFDGNLAWQQAVRLCSANKELLLVLAGVFFFLPGVTSAFFLSGLQEDLMRNMAAANQQDPKAMFQALSGIYAQMGPYIVGLLLVQTVGTMSMMALLTDAARPTVGQAILLGLKRLPTVFGVGLLLMLGYVLSGMVFVLVLGILGAIVGVATGAAAGAGAMSAPVIIIVAIGTAGFIGFLIYAVTRLSLTLPAIVIDQIANPWRALRRSWALTRGNTATLLGFYLVLMVAYAVIGMVVFMLLSTLVKLGTPQYSKAYFTANGLVSGLISGVVSILASAIIAAVHGQLAGGGGRESLSETFR
ncbi:glycerophosphoryl diester phosphodiesterase membrane domain-containing protein [Novosphingobium rosa]|uniref:glycerophosphoryl diester phosphodiesterase membrane domain-containing protein n=1 Tax=Novosphingobium rosa TaxID=76978 RepID=UPI000831D528|nr:glycerophosphoryl diester phosphodiesterase membrane domain-containing protein [Novosphingobium rosa]